MENESVLLKIKDRIGIITINRPDHLNALDGAAGESLWNTLESCDRNEDVRVVILRGRGRAFCSGGDVKGMRDALKKDIHRFLMELTRFVHESVLAIRKMAKPVIAQVNGYASGGGFGLVLACDMVVASEKARFNQAFVLIGASPDSSSTFFLPRLVGLQKASELIYFGDFIDAREGQRLGFVNKVVPEELLEETTLELAKRLAKGPPLAFAKSKALINQGLVQALEAQMEEERHSISASGLTEDFREGIEAFFKKEPPRFKGR